MEQWALIEDHIPIRIILSIAANISREATSTRYALDKLDTKGLTADLQGQQLDTLEIIQNTLTTLLPKYCPKARPSPRARPEWSPRASTLLVGARRARRRYTATGNEEDRWEA